MRLVLRPFADLVFHVLAHVPAPFAASVHDRAYVAWCEARLGPAGTRELGEGASVLARTLTSHDACVRVQRLAWLFGDLESASRAFDRPLSELPEAEVARPRLLPGLRGDPLSETLFCTVALEAAWHARLPPLDLDAGLESALGARRLVAPELWRFGVGVVRSLVRRGRVFEDEIWVGAPGDAAPWADRELVAWQAAHEATVAELAAARLPFEEHERAAVALLAERAARAREVAAHARWLATLDAAPPRREALSQGARTAVDAALDRSST